MTRKSLLLISVLLNAALLLLLVVRNAREESIAVRLDGREINDQTEVLQGMHQLDVFLNDQFQQRATFTVSPMRIVSTPNHVVDITPEIEAIVRQNADVASAAPEVSVARLINDEQVEIKIQTSKQLPDAAVDAITEAIHRRTIQSHNNVRSGRITLFYQNGNDYKKFTLSFGS